MPATLLPFSLIMQFLSLVVVDRNAQINGHFAPRPASASANTAAGDIYIKAKMNELRALLRQHLQDFAQKPSSTGIVAYAIYMGVPALQSQREIIESQFRSWKMQFKSVPYPVLNSDQPQAPAKGTVLIVPKDGGAEVYVEDKRVASVKGTALSDTGSSAAESSKAASK